MSETDETETRRLVREAFQLLVALESNLHDDSDGGLEVGNPAAGARTRRSSGSARRRGKRNASSGALGGGRGGPQDAHIDG